jgi:hypothetical protein
MTSFLYMCLSYDDWQEFKKTGKFKCMSEFEKPEVLGWYKTQVEKRLGTTIEHPHYCFYDKSKIFYPAKRAVIKIRIDTNLVVPFNDHEYVHVLDCLYNNIHIFNSLSQKEYNESKTASVQECFESYERMFDLSLDRDYKWCGVPDLRAFIPYLKRDMVRKVWIFKYNKRLRRRKT